MATQTHSVRSAATLGLLVLVFLSGTAEASTQDELVELFEDWRAFEYRETAPLTSHSTVPAHDIPVGLDVAPVQVDTPAVATPAHHIIVE
ncbi:MAG: hypothetical protein ACWGPN_18015, partial [Gammaproteobacteria bacterium]